VTALVGVDGSGQTVVCYTATGSATPRWTTGDTRFITFVSSFVCSRGVRAYLESHLLNPETTVAYARAPTYGPYDGLTQAHTAGRYTRVSDTQLQRVAFRGTLQLNGGRWTSLPPSCSGANTSLARCSYETAAFAFTVGQDDDVMYTPSEPHAEHPLCERPNDVTCVEDPLGDQADPDVGVSTAMAAGFAPLTDFAVDAPAFGLTGEEITVLPEHIRPGAVITRGDLEVAPPLDVGAATLTAGPPRIPAGYACQAKADRPKREKTANIVYAVGYNNCRSVTEMELYVTLAVRLDGKWVNLDTDALYDLGGGVQIGVANKVCDEFPKAKYLNQTAAYALRRGVWYAQLKKATNTLRC
jgi:hypothetical protein